MTELENLKVSATVIVISKDRKALIVQRQPDKAFSNLWTVAGGKLQDTDGVLKSEGFLYNSVEHCAVRELYEETGIAVDVEKLTYLCSITTVWGDTRRVILSFYIVLDKDAKDIRIALDECQDYRWVEDYLLDSYNFIPDIDGEIKDVFKILEKERKEILARILES